MPEIHGHRPSSSRPSGTAVTEPEGLAAPQSTASGSDFQIALRTSSGSCEAKSAAPYTMPTSQELDAHPVASSAHTSAAVRTPAPWPP